jgi:hypothetical protein
MHTDVGVTVFRSDNSVAFKGVLQGKLYLVDFTNDKAKLDTCLTTKTEYGLALASPTCPYWDEESPQASKM